METKICTKCHEEKSIDKFYDRKSGSHTIKRGSCKNCHRLYLGEWRAKNKAHIRERDKIYRQRRPDIFEKTRCRTKEKNRREIIITTGNKKISGLHKRPHPEEKGCEICHRPDKQLVYHHWDDNNPSLGLWVCKICHDMCEQIDKGLDLRYQVLKTFVENEGKKE